MFVSIYFMPIGYFLLKMYQHEYAKYTASRPNLTSPTVVILTVACFLLHTFNVMSSDIDDINDDDGDSESVTMCEQVVAI